MIEVIRLAINKIKMIKRLLFIVPVAALILSVIGNLLPVSAAAAGSGFSNDAQIQATFVDGATVMVTASGTYTTSSGQTLDLTPINGFYYDNSFSGYYSQGGDKKTGVNSECQSTFVLTVNRGGGDNYPDPTAVVQTDSIVLPTDSGKKADFSISLPPTGTTGTKCINVTKNGVQVYDPGTLASITYVQTGSDRVVRADEDPIFDSTTPEKHAFTSITLSDGSTVFSNKASGFQCPALISIPDSTGKSTLTDQENNGTECKVKQKHTVYLMDNAAYQSLQQQVSANADNVQAAGGGSSGTPKVTNPTASLDCHAGINPLNWLLCAAVKGMVNIVGALDNLINDLLAVGSPATGTDKTDPSQIFGASSNTTTGQYSTSAAQARNNTPAYAYYQAWSSFRNIALGLMVLVGLIVVIAQALGSDIVDAYTVRKVLPRLLIAAVGISLSWQLMQFFVKFTNELGYGVRSLMYGPFGYLQNSIKASGGAGLATDFVAGGAIAALGIFGLLSFAATAALAVFVAVLILILRQIVIIILIILAPIAIVAYILPNTQKIYQFWFDSFSKALLMFPIIVALIAAGHIFALVSIQRDDAISQIIGFIAYFAPYFLLPVAFKLAGGTLGRLAGAVNDKGRGGFDRLKNFRKNKIASNMEKTRNYSRLSDRNKVTRGINTVMGAAANPRNLSRGIAGVRAGRQSGRYNQGTNALKNDAVYQANQNDDTFLLGLANEGLAEQKLSAAKAKFADAQLRGDEAGMSSAQADINARSRGLNAARQVQSRGSAGTRLQALQALAKTGYQFDSGDAGYRQLTSTVQSITGSDRGAAAAAMDEAQFHLKNAGRSDLGGINHGDVNDIKTGVRKQGNYGRGQGKVNTYEGGASAWLGASVVDTNTGKTKTSAAMSNEIVNSISRGDTSLESVAEWHEMLAGDYGSATDANKLEIQKQMDAINQAALGFRNDSRDPSNPLPQEQAEAFDRFHQKLKINEQIKNRGVGTEPDPSQRT